MTRLTSPHNILTAYSRGEIGATDAMSMLHIETMAELQNAMADVGHPFPAALPKREPMIFRKYRENAEAIWNMGKDAIAEAHRAGVAASYVAPELGEGIVRETPDGIRHLEQKVGDEWVEVATFPPRKDWVYPRA